MIRSWWRYRSRSSSTRTCRKCNRFRTTNTISNASTHAPDNEKNKSWRLLATTSVTMFKQKVSQFFQKFPPPKKSSHGSLCFISDVFKITSIVTKDLDYFSKKIYHTEFFKNGPIWSHWHRLRQVLIAHRMPLSFCGRGFEFIRN